MLLQAKKLQLIIQNHISLRLFHIRCFNSIMQLATTLLFEFQLHQHLESLLRMYVCICALRRRPLYQWRSRSPQDKIISGHHMPKFGHSRNWNTKIVKSKIPKSKRLNNSKIPNSNGLNFKTPKHRNPKCGMPKPWIWKPKLPMYW